MATGPTSHENSNTNPSNCQELNEISSLPDEMSKLTKEAPVTPCAKSENSEKVGGEIKIVVAGGVTTKKVRGRSTQPRSESVEAYICTSEQIEHGTWLFLSRMNECRHAASSVVYEEKEENQKNKEKPSTSSKSPCKQKPRPLRMIVTGGHTDGLGTAFDIEELDLAQQNGPWSEFSLKTPLRKLYGHACVVHKHRLLVIGGRFDNEDNKRIYEIELTKPPNHELRPLIEMPRSICFHGAVKADGKIFIIGGTEGSNTRQNVLAFELKEILKGRNTYKELNPLPYPVAQMATAVWRDNLIVCGGRENDEKVLNKAILYNVTTKRHFRLPEMTKKRFGCNAVTIGDKIIVMGGYGEDGKPLKSAEWRDLAKDGTSAWKTFPDMNDERAGATAVRCNIPWENMIH